MRVLDHGSIEMVESWGSDERIIEAARMSTAKGFVGWGDADKPGDEKLLRYLWENAHATPFEMAGAIFEVKAPIFVFREWHRHRTQSYNEMSGRYVPLPDENYIPSIERILATSKTNKQAGTIEEARTLNANGAQLFRERLAGEYASQESLYQEALSFGVPKELARVVLPVGRYSRMRASANLRNWLAFLTLRCDLRAMWEIRQYANAVADELRTQFPRTLAIARPR
jgi:thymidylate synthase (FAD)